jgi:hypothetical protein
MSHTATVKSIQIQSVSALRAAVEELAQTGVRCSLIENATPRAYFSNQAGMGPAAFVIRLEDSPYDIGLYKTEAGGYEARTDFYRGAVEGVLGARACTPETSEQAKMGKLFQMYGVHAATEAARKKGHMVRRIVKEDGRIALEITGANL